MNRYSIPSDQRPGLAAGADLIDSRGPDDRVEVLVVRADGTRDGVVMQKPAAEMIAKLLREASASDAVALLGESVEISPEDAASILGISRPLVRRRMDAGILPFRRVGTHRRLRLSDVIGLKHREASVRAALDDLRADTGDLIAHGL